jgi:hypothetical protein
MVSFAPSTIGASYWKPRYGEDVRSYAVTTTGALPFCSRPGATHTTLVCVDANVGGVAATGVDDGARHGRPPTVTVATCSDAQRHAQHPDEVK